MLLVQAKIKQQLKSYINSQDFIAKKNSVPSQHHVAKKQPVFLKQEPPFQTILSNNIKSVNDTLSFDLKPDSNRQQNTILTQTNALSIKYLQTSDRSTLVAPSNVCSSPAHRQRQSLETVIPQVQNIILDSSDRPRSGLIIENNHQAEAQLFRTGLTPT